MIASEHCKLDTYLHWRMYYDTSSSHGLSAYEFDAFRVLVPGPFMPSSVLAKRVP